MLRNFFKRSKNLQPPLGRWKIGQSQSVIDEKVKRSNEDHCGAELCQKSFEKNIEKERKLDIKNKIKMNDKKLDFDPLLPFCM
jgi:hypothetical protein